MYIVYPFVFVVLMLLSFKVFAQSGADYQPNVDVYGKKVIAADITGSIIEPPRSIEFDLDIDLAKYMGIIVPKGMLNEANITHVRIENGRVYFDNQQVETTAKDLETLKNIGADKNDDRDGDAKEE